MDAQSPRHVQCRDGSGDSSVTKIIIILREKMIFLFL